MILIYYAQFTYIFIGIYIMGQPLTEIGSKYFIIQAFFDFLVTSGFFITILIYGAEANLIDDKIKHQLMKI